MFSSASFFRLAFNRFRPPRNLRNAVRSLTTSSRFYQNFRLPLYIAPTLGFSLFTWMGFDKASEATAEDELIMSIKHCILFIQRSEYDKAERLLHVALRQAQQTFNEMGITYIYDVMANLALRREQLDKSKKLFVSVAQRLMQKGVKEDDLRIIHISLKLARISHLQKEYTTAQTGFEWCLKKLNEKYKDDPTEDINKLIAMAEDWYGMLFVDCNEAERGLELLLSSRERTSHLSDFLEEHAVIQLNDIATVCEKLNRLDDSVRYLMEAVEKGRKLEEMPDLGAIHVNLGRIYLKKGMANEARKACGYAWRLGHDRKDEEIKKQALLCIDEIKKL